MKGPKYNLLNKRFERLIVTNQTSKRYKGYVVWECLCDCGNIVFYDCSRLILGRIKSCGCLKTDENVKHFNYKGYKDISKTYITTIKHRANRRNLGFDITIEYISDLLEKQNHKCALSGLPIYLKNKKDKTASLDRIDNSKGYIKGNVQWLHKDINDLKSNYSDEEFIKICGLIWNNCKDIKKYMREAA